jgi:hypothetical protein
MSFNEKKCFFFWSEKCSFFLLKTAFSVFLKPIPFILQHNETLVGFKPILIFFSAKKKGELQRFSRSLSLSLSNTSWNITFQRRRKLNGGFRIWLFSAKMFFSLFSFLGRKEKMINLFSRLNEQDKVETKYKNVNFFSSKLSFRFKQLLKGENWMKNKVTDK